MRGRRTRMSCPRPGRRRQPAAARRSLPGLRIPALAAAAPPGRGSGALLLVLAALADPVQLALGPLGPGAQLGAGILEHLGAGLQGGAQLVALAGSVAAYPVQLPRGGGAASRGLGRPFPVPRL